MPDEKTTNESTKRPAPISWRPPAARHAEFLARVERSGLSVNAYITRAVFRPSYVDAGTLVRLLSEAAAIRDALHDAGLIGGDTPANAQPLETALDDLTELRAAILEILGRRP